MKAVKHLDDNLHYDTYPDTCPICHHGIHPHRITSNVIYEGDRAIVLQLFFSCPRRPCQRAFIATYRQKRDRYGHQEGLYLLQSTAPFKPPAPAISEEVKAVSPSYYTILGQAQAAEHWELDQISGVGYRKALEYLIKDYAIYKNTAKSDDIKHAWLGEVIGNYISEVNIKTCASRAVWLGNDEAHYSRIWTDKDISDLKTLIRLSEAWILNDILTGKYLEDMNPKK